MDEVAPAEDQAPVYAFRPRMIGADVAFRLGADSLEWFSGARQGRVAYAMIRRMRLGYRPTTFMGRRFTTEVYPQNGGRLEIASASARALGGSVEQGPHYRAFVTELHRRVKRAGATCEFTAGFAAWRWWPAVAVTAIFAALLAFATGRALLMGEWSTLLLMLGAGALLAWQMGPIITRNRPRRYSADAIPEDVLPNA